MKVLFGAEKLERLTQKFIIQLFGFLYDRAVTGEISINTVKVRAVDDLNETTVITLRSKHNQLYVVKVDHARDMCCSQWSMELAMSAHTVKAYQDFRAYEAKTPTRHREPSQKRMSTMLFNKFTRSCADSGQDYCKVLPKLSAYVPEM